MSVVRAAAVQLSPVLYSREATVEKVVRAIHQLGEQGVQFAAFPETVVPYYNRPELLSLRIDRTPTAFVHERDEHSNPAAVAAPQELLVTAA